MWFVGFVNVVYEWVFAFEVDPGVTFHAHCVGIT